MMTFVTVLLLPLLCGAALGDKGAFERILDVNQGRDQSSPYTVPRLFEGDVRLTKEQQLNNAVYGDPDRSPSRAATNVDKIKWPNAVIPYEFDCSVANMDRAVRTTMEAIREWESKTCIRFVKRTTEEEYLWFHRGQGCWCEVGKVRGRKTWLSIGDGCEYKHVMTHEIGHAIGFWHEQSRPDRDSYLKINWENIIQGLEDNFKKKKWNSEVVDYGVPYDYASIMHYPWTAFSKDWNKKTLEPIRPLNGKTPYVRLSDDDALQANRMYKCSGRSVQSSEECSDVSSASDCEGWKDAGFCQQHEAMKYWCKKTCRFCVSATTQPPVTTSACGGSSPPTQSPGSQPPPTSKPKGAGYGLRCLDKRRECPQWAEAGDCATNGWTERICRISCKTKCDNEPVKPQGECSEAFGLGWPGNYKLPDSAFSASTEYRPGTWRASADNARLYFEDDQDQLRIGAWCASERNNQWLKIDLGQVKRIRAIATQGRDVFHEHVKEYRLAFSTDGSSFEVYKENGQEKVFTGNCDHFTPVINTFNSTRARYVKILVGKSAYPCMRVELYGCDA